MKKLYGIFYLSRGKWVGPAHEELMSEEDIIDNSGCENASVSFVEHVKSYLKECRKQYRKPIKLKMLTWKDTF